jgi:D-glycero-D-manno-heptose 1,7-bisphosphate phosphatase
VPGTRSALFVDWGGTLALTENNRTVVDRDGHPVLMPNVAATLSRERQRFDVCFIVSNQARISRGEISLDEVYRRFAWADEQLGGPFTDWRLCPHSGEHGCGCRKPRPGMFLELAELHGVDLGSSIHVGDSESDRGGAASAGVGTFVWARDFFGWTG